MGSGAFGSDLDGSAPRQHAGGQGVSVVLP